MSPIHPNAGFLWRPFFALFLCLAACASAGPGGSSGAAEPVHFDPSEISYEDRIYMDGIHTVQLFKKGFELSAPLLEMGSADQLVLRFDHLDPQPMDLSYALVHCAADWRPSDLLPAEFLSGMYSDRLPPGEQSFNTLESFIHYELNFPNDLMRITRSGNYLLKVYRGQDEDDLVLTQRFMVFEPRMEIKARIVRTRVVEQRDHVQQVELTVLHPGVDVQDPFGDVEVVILQNMRWDDMRFGFKPRFVKSYELVYDHQPPAAFEGLNEWRNFDLKNLRYTTIEVGAIRPGPVRYEAFLVPDEKRNIKYYYEEPDINGRLLVKNDDAWDQRLESDYVDVHFNLPMPAPEVGDVYVFGDLSDMQCKKEFRMTWNEEASAYELKVKLKQGYYNYMYAYLSPRMGAVADIKRIEGSHFNTENDYLVLVYLRDRSYQYDRLVAARFLNSRRDF